MLDRIDDTIVAISSAAGASPVGIVRLSGPAAIGVAARIARVGGPGESARAEIEDSPSQRRAAARRACGTQQTLEHCPAWTRIEGEIEPVAGASFPAFFYLFRAPKSYTRQDVVEIYTVGAPVILDMVRRACVEGGARDAEPGEFTARAFFAGALDLAQAEAVAGVIRAQSDAQLRASRRMLDGDLARRIGELRNDLAELLALVEADIDFAEEPIEFITPPELVARLRRLTASLEALLAAGPPMERLSRLPHILLLGPPNAGKSSLMNRLSGSSRAICAAVAGTTRDILSAPIRLGRGEAILLDSGGIDETEEQIIASARAMALSAAENVDLVCLVIDAAEVIAGAFEIESFFARIRRLSLPATMVALNKVDLCSGAGSESQANYLAAAQPAIARAEQLNLGPVVGVSATQGYGIDEFRRVLEMMTDAAPAAAAEHSTIMTERQHVATAEALAAIQRAGALAASAAETVDCADLLAFELREALDALGGITGAVTTEDLLSHVFARFCIGK